MRSCRFTVLAAALTVALSAGAWAAPDPAAQLGFPPNVAAAMQGIDPERIRAHVRFLADDLLEGRGTGARGGDIAARSIAAQFALDGLKPAGDDGTYLQAVSFTRPDAEPGAGHYYRSDHFSFARVGVPSFSINTALKFSGHPPEWAKAQRDDYTARRYHQPSDEYTPDMDFASNAALAKFGFALGWQAPTARQTVGWLPGDEFEAKRLESAKGL
jgi:Zn-dependent M28 family amino/carboxypeptidase